MKMYSLSEMEDEFIGKIGTAQRNVYEEKFQLDMLSDVVQQIMKKENISKEALSIKAEVPLAQISKFERQPQNINFFNVVKILKALDIRLNVLKENKTMMCLS
ncbi:MAG: helix-turn-helix domain-containing protein [Chitinivibrionia bacterium]|nr:helix-turn-helix domain-containing protein [Chitinivibrionia bacterium]